MISGHTIDTTFPIADGVAEADLVHRVVRRTATGMARATDNEAHYPKGFAIACHGKTGVAVARLGHVDALFGAAFDPDDDGELLTFDDEGRLIAAAADDYVVAEWQDEDPVTAGEIAAGALRRVLALQPYKL